MVKNLSEFDSKEYGAVILNAKDISTICKELEISEADLFENSSYKTMQNNKSIKPL